MIESKASNMKVKNQLIAKQHAFPILALLGFFAFMANPPVALAQIGGGNNPPNKPTLRIKLTTSQEFSLRFYGNRNTDYDYWQTYDRVKIPGDGPATPVDIGGEDFTFEFWMKADSTENIASMNCGSGNGWINGNIMFDRDRYGLGRNYGIVTHGNRNAMAIGIMNEFNEAYTICGNTNVQDDEWHHVAIQRRRADGYIWIYVDGQLDVEYDGPDGDISYPDGATPTNSCGGLCTNSDPYLVIAAEKHNVAANGYSGLIDEVHISNILRYNANFTRPTLPFLADTSTLGLYHFDEGSGTVAIDSSGQASPTNGEVQYGGTPAGPVWVTDTPFAVNPTPGSIYFAENVIVGNDDYGLQTDIPAGFGEGEFTFELWIKPDNNYPVGPVTGWNGNISNKAFNWSDVDNQPYSSSSWWYDGNFLLDGHNNNSGNIEGTFSLQFYGGGRLRWHFGDGVYGGEGGHWSVEAYPASSTPSLLDGVWHQVTLVRRWVGTAEADLELWIDGSLIATERSSERTNMRNYWDSWVGWQTNQAGWFWGTEKQVAINNSSQYEDYKGLIDEIRYWNLAKTAEEIGANFNASVSGNESGLVGYYDFSEGQGNAVINQLNVGDAITLINMKTGYWVDENPPLEK